MNLEKLDVQRVQHSRPQMQRVLTDDVPTTPVHVRYDNAHRASYSSASEAATVIPWHSPPPQLQAPTPPQRYTIPQSPPYTPIKNDSPDHTPRQTQYSREDSEQSSGGTDEEQSADRAPQVVRFNEEQIRSDRNMGSNKDKRVQIEMETDTPTPNTEEYTRYIQFALQQLTAHEEFNAQQRPSTAVSMDSAVDRIIPTLPVEQQDSLTRQEKALVRKHRSSPVYQVASSQGILYSHNPTPKLSPTIMAPPILPRPSYKTSPSAIPPPRDTNLTFKPTIIRLPSMMIPCIICLLMIAAIVFCAVYAPRHQGLTQWAGGLSGGWYFVFAFLPQFLAACILIYVQCVMAAVTRIMPFTMMASDESKAREKALFLGIYPRSLIYPRWVGNFTVDVAMTLLWLTIFTIPMQSCLFSVIPVADGWRWTTVTGVARALVAIYVLILVGTMMIAVFFFRKTTGLRWDARSLADLVTLLPQNNLLEDFKGTDQVESKDELKRLLAKPSYRLGWWSTEKYEDRFHGIGEEDTQRPKHQGSRTPYITGTANPQQISTWRQVRFRYISWQLQDTLVIFWIVTAFVLLIALIVLSFLSTTAIRNGFPPLVKAAPDAHGFSLSNFLYSFVPSIIGMLLYLLFQPLDMAIRKLQPWAGFGPEGATAADSLLLDYTANLPMACTVNALVSGHYRVAFTSLLSSLFILLPILAGGLFFPLTVASGEVRMIPNLPSFYVIIILLVLYLIGLLILLPGRRRLHLPHDVNCLAEIFSFLYNSPIIADAEFVGVKSKPDLVRRLMLSAKPGEAATRFTATGKLRRETRYTFGVFKGRNQEYSFGIDKVARQGRGSGLVTFGV